MRILLFGFILSIFLFLGGLHIDKQKTRQAFKHRSQVSLLRIEKRLQKSLEALDTLGKRQNRASLDSFTFKANAAILSQLQPEIILQAWLPRVSPENTQIYLQMAQLIHRKDYIIKKGPFKHCFPDCYPVLHVYPAAMAQKILGLCPLTYREPMSFQSPELKKAVHFFVPCRLDSQIKTSPDSLMLAFIDPARLIAAAVNQHLSKGLDFSIALKSCIPNRDLKDQANEKKLPSNQHQNWFNSLETSTPAGLVTISCKSSPAQYGWLSSYIHWNLFFAGLLGTMGLAVLVHFLPLPPGIQSRRALKKEIAVRKKTEFALKDSTKMLNLALRAFDEGIWDLNLEKGRASFSDHFFSILGYTAEDFLEHPESLLELVHPLDRDLTARTWDRLTGAFGKEEELEIRVKDKKGHWTWIWIKASVQKRNPSDKKPLRIVGAATKIQKRKTAELALLEKTLVLKQMYQFTPIGLIFENLNSKIISANPAACSMLGHKEEDLIDTCLSDYMQNQTNFDPELVSELLGGNINSIKSEAQLLTREKKKIWVENTLAIIRNEKNAPSFFVVVLTNITSEKHAEEKKVLMDIHMRQVQKMEAMGTLAGGVAHDFNNILTPILIHTETALMERELDPKLKFKIKEIQTASLRARDLAAQILDFSRPKSKKVGALRLSVLIKEIMNLLRSALPSNIEIVQNLEATSLLVKADATEVHQIVMNLCTNAAHAMSPKGGVLTISLAETRIPAKGESPAVKKSSHRYLVLKIKDTGKGIPKDIQEKIFEPYFTTKKTGEGTGLGLAVVKGIIESYQGIIELESEPGRGASFSIYLPAIKEKPLSKTIKFTPRFSSKKAFLGIIDDDRPSLDAMSSLLRAMGYKIRAFSDPEKALKELADTEKIPDIIITDYAMPHIDGEELIQRLRIHKPDLPAVILTGQKNLVTIKEDQHKKLKIMQKPVTRQEINLVLENLLGSES